MEAARITDQAGVDAIGAKGFKEMVKMIESKDSDVRNATLDALVAAFSQAKKIGPFLPFEYHVTLTLLLRWARHQNSTS